MNRKPRINLVDRELRGFLFLAIGPVDEEHNELTYRYRHKCGHEGIIRASKVVTTMPLWCDGCRPVGGAARSGVKW